MRVRVRVDLPVQHDTLTDCLGKLLQAATSHEVPTKLPDDDWRPGVGKQGMGEKVHVGTASALGQVV